MQNTAIITGASSGIGYELALLLAREGFDLGLIARRDELLVDLQTVIYKNYPKRKVLTATCDVTNIPEIQNTIHTLSSQLGSLGMFIANAGIGHSTPAWKDSWKETLEIMNVNVIGAIASIEAAKSIMLKQKSGHLVGIASVAANRGLAYSSAYCSSKAALSVYLESLRVDLKNIGIKVSAIHPGFIATPMTAKNKSMPFLLSSKKAAEHIFCALKRNKTRFVFPWQMAIIYQVLRFMPDGVYDFIMGYQGKVFSDED